MTITTGKDAEKAKHAQKPEKAAKPKRKPETMKRIVWLILYNAVAWIWCSYGLALLGREQIAQDLSITALSSIVAVVLAYALKSLGEKHSLNKHGLRIPNADSADAGKGKHRLDKPPTSGTEDTEGV